MGTFPFAPQFCLVSHVYTFQGLIGPTSMSLTFLPFAEAKLGYDSDALELRWTDVAQWGVPPPVVPNFDNPKQTLR